METAKTNNYLNIVVPEIWDGLSIEQLLKEFWKLPRKMIHQYRMDKSIHINGQPIPFSTKLATGDTLSISVFTEKEYGVLPTPIDIEILFEDEHLLIVNKPANLATHPNDTSDTYTLANAVAHHLQKKGEIAKVQHIHRLDKDTTGAILFAKHSLSGVLLDQMLEGRKIKRTYTALVHGKLAQQKGTIHKKIGRDRHHPTRRRVSPSGQDAITHYEVIHYNEKTKISQIYCRLDTGRTHQIRVHLSSIGHPLVGDVLYGGKPIVHRQALHAKFLSFIHPITLKKVEIEAPYLDKPAIFEG
ncbi:RluA family pseudouridine synthase [Caldibacillus lycopersici]|uniref:Pseudouridine synthase n=1 Tax=Perspicuibacillus lycopersici TaxID=1325689 RepID=A0AAE3IQ90_9BACI|nr:RluA family pseudouridine synthase [Perspicuibacillus lycopersici]MCU9612563.1 RluA family pseudouridine synthase [Perspicuibacillus lycopersici]